MKHSEPEAATRSWYCIPPHNSGPRRYQPRVHVFGTDDATSWTRPDCQIQKACNPQEAAQAKEEGLPAVPSAPSDPRDGERQCLTSQLPRRLARGNPKLLLATAARRRLVAIRLRAATGVLASTLGISRPSEIERALLLCLPCLFQNCCSLAPRVAQRQRRCSSDRSLLLARSRGFP